MSLSDPAGLVLALTLASAACGAMAQPRRVTNVYKIGPFYQDSSRKYDPAQGSAAADKAGAPLDVTAAAVSLPAGVKPPIGARINCSAADAAGHIWVGTDAGIAVYCAGAWQVINGAAGLPVLDVRQIAFGADGSVWAGTSAGAERLLGGKWRYYASRRWLCDDDVKAISLAPPAQPGAPCDAWVQTATGVAQIAFRKSTMAEKAAYYETTVARHNRRGYVADGRLTRPGDVTSFRFDATDNDGLWTSLYVAAASFRYAATRSPEARALARKSAEAMFFLHDITGIPGFMARAVKRNDEDIDGRDPNDPNWGYVNPKYPDYHWKDDTSSDEVDGHYMAFYIYHELVATAAEKKRIAGYIRATTNYLMDHDWYLIGPSGKHTTWGVWNPKEINDNPRWIEEHGLNSLELLCYLKVASHICGDQRFKDAYQEMVRKHHYALNTVDQKTLPPLSNNHSDDELAWCAYYPLLMLEKDPALRRIYLMSLERTQRILQPEGSPFYNFMYAAVTDQPCGVEDGVEWLRNCPLDLIEWGTKSSHRADITIAGPPDRFERAEATRVLPNNERRATRWNSNPYVLDEGGNGTAETEGTFWLLPYWLGRYHGVIGDAGK